MARDRLPVDRPTSKAFGVIQRRIDELRESFEIDDTIVLDEIADVLQGLYDAATEGR